jgi:hypothetical protein
MKIELSIINYRGIDLPMKKRVRHGKGKTTRTAPEMLCHYSLTNVESTFCGKTKSIGNGLFVEGIDASVKDDNYKPEIIKGNVDVISDITEKHTFVSKKLSKLYYCQSLQKECFKKVMPDNSIVWSYSIEQISKKGKSKGKITRVPVLITNSEDIDTIVVKNRSTFVETFKGRHIQPKIELHGKTFIPYTDNVNTILVSACKMVGKLKEGKHTLKVHVNIVNDEGEEVLRKFQGKQLQSRFIIGKVVIDNITERGVWFEKETIEAHKWLQKMLNQFARENESLLPED